MGLALPQKLPLSTRRLFGNNAKGDTGRPKPRSAFKGVIERTKNRRNRVAEDLPANEVEDVVTRALKYTKRGMLFDHKPVMKEIYRALGALEQATITIDSIREPLREALSVVETASKLEDQHAIHLLAQQYDECLNQVDERCNAATYDQLNLVSGANQHYEVVLDPEGRARLVIGHANLTTSGLGLPFSADAFTSVHPLKKLKENLETVLGQIDRMAQIYCNDAHILVDHYKSLARKTEGKSED